MMAATPGAATPAAAPPATGAVGAPLARIEAREKVTGAARYAYEHQPDEVAYATAVPATIARGSISALDAAAAMEVPGVLAVLWHATAPRLRPVADGELAVLQSDRVAYRGQFVALVVAETLEAAREAERLVAISYEPEEHDSVLREDHPGLYAPETVNPSFPAATSDGDVEAGLRAAAVAIDKTYRTPALHNNAMEPHATVALWDGDDLTCWDSNQGAPAHRATLAQVFGLDPERVRVISPHVGGGFGSKGSPRPQLVLAALAARVVARPVKLAVTRRQMWAVTGYRTPTIQRLRLGADAEGRLTAIAHDVVEQTSTVREFAEQTAVATRMMYAAPNRSTSHRLVALDVPTPSWMRAPGECPGMFALESAVDELAIAAGIDPIELRVRNEPEVDPHSGHRFSSRGLIACLREGAERFGWAGRDPAPGVRREGCRLVGTGVAASTYPVYRRGAQAFARAEPGGGFTVGVGAADIGTGARTALTQIAADALGARVDEVRVELGDSALPRAPVAGGSAGTASWGTAVVKACRALRERLDGEHGGVVPPDGLRADADSEQDVADQEPMARHAFGAQFAEVKVDLDTGETEVSRLLGVFGVGRIVNPRTARSQLVGGMTMGMGMALLEESVLDPQFGDYVNHDLAGYHVACNADVRDIQAHWIDEEDPHLNPMGSKGIGEIGIVGTAAAIANAVHHATGIRVRELPIRLDDLLWAEAADGG
jgi:xanthine dehydrogenase YagR molybdenum-binding subunit